MKTAHIPFVKETLGFFEKAPSALKSMNRALIESLVRNSEEYRCLVEKMDNVYGLRGFSYLKMETVEEFYLEWNVMFDTKEELFEFVNQHKIKLPSIATKTSQVKSDGTPILKYEYEWRESDDVGFCLSYIKIGLPSEHCRVVASTHFSIACDLEGNGK